MKFSLPSVYRGKKIDGRLLYIIPQEHVNEPGLRRHPTIPNIKHYHQYAKDIRNRLNKDGVDPRDCIIYLENVRQNIDQKAVVKFLTEESPIHFPDDLLTTFVLPLYRKDALVRGVEDYELLERLGDEIAASQRGADERDIKMREFIKNDLPIGKVGIFLVGANHNFLNLFNYFSQTDIRLRTVSDLYRRYLETAELYLPDSSSSGWIA